MITAAGKYTDVREAAERPSAPCEAGSAGSNAGVPLMPLRDRLPVPTGNGLPAKAGTPNPVQTSGPTATAAARGRSAQIMVPNRKVMIRWDEWMWKELRSGGYLMRYIEAEKARSPLRARAVGRQMQNFSVRRQATNSWDWELKAAIPAREFFRWKKEDPDFWRDDSNLRSLKRDNPDLCIYNVGARRTRDRKTYS